MELNLRNFLMKTAALVLLVAAIRSLFQAPIEYFGIDLFSQTQLNRVFSKIDALKVIGAVAIFFGLYHRKRITSLSHGEIKWLQSLLFLAGGLIAVALYYAVRAFTNLHPISSWIAQGAIVALILVVLGSAFLLCALAVFQYEYSKAFYQEFGRSLLVASATALLGYALLMLFQSQWLLFSGSVAWLMARMLGPFYDVLYYFKSPSGTPVIQIGSFAASIAAPCSGIDSLFLFVAFFAALYALDHKRIRTIPYAIAFIGGAIGVFFVNVVRLVLLVIVGVHISPKFAVGMFHTNAGWLLFVVYFLCYYYLMKKFIYRQRIPERK
jgi:exosortase/archaeosortase family protein